MTNWRPPDTGVKGGLQAPDGKEGQDFDKELSAGDEPFVSVVIYADAREGRMRDEFLLQAIESVESQSLGRRRIEVIVTKNFRSAQIDEALFKRGVRVIFDDCESVGLRRVHAVEFTRAPFVAFLSDDDFFGPRHLESGLRAFSANPTVGFYKCRFQAVDARGVEFRNLGSSRGNEFFRNGSVTVSKSGWTSSYGAQFQTQLADACSVESTMVIRKVLVPLQNLATCQASLDYATFLDAAISAGDMYFAAERNVFKRSHPLSHSKDRARRSVRARTLADLICVARSHSLFGLADAWELWQKALILYSTIDGQRSLREGASTFLQLLEDSPHGTKLLWSTVRHVVIPSSVAWILSPALRNLEGLPLLNA